MSKIIPIPQLPEQTDEWLVNAFKKEQNQQHLATLYLRYSDLVYGVCLKYLEDAEDAKDAVMNIYQELLEKLPKHEVQNFKSWLYVLAKNHCLMQLRSQKKHTTVAFAGENMYFEENVHLDIILEKEKEFKKLEQCMDTLQQEQKMAIQLFYLESKCYNEIVASTGMEWNKVRSLIQNGRRSLKICMEKNGG